MIQFILEAVIYKNKIKFKISYNNRVLGLSSQSAYIETTNPLGNEYCTGVQKGGSGIG
jgi:hypothetical protein